MGMNYYLVEGEEQRVVCAMPDDSDALLEADVIWRGHEDQDESINTCDSGLYGYVQGLREVYKVMPLTQYEVLELVQKRLDGDESISVRL